MKELDQKLKKLTEYADTVNDSINNYVPGRDKVWLGDLDDEYNQLWIKIRELKEKEGVEYCDQCGTLQLLDQLIDYSKAPKSGDICGLICRKCDG